MNKYKYLFFRRVVQVGILILFFGANAYGWKILQGSLSSSLIFETIPLSDPYAALQMLFAGAVLSVDVLLGMFIVIGFYGLIGGRAFCAWVCPMNLVTDFAAFLRRVLGWDKMERKVWLKRNLRYWILALSLVISLASGIAAFEAVSPIGILTRSVAFGLGMSLAAVGSVFLFDLLVLKNGWCGYICPLGGSYALIGKFSLIRVWHKKEKCTHCMKCKIVCPEKEVLGIIGKEDGFITKGECINCGRCIEVCDDDALNFGFRLIGEKNDK